MIGSYNPRLSLNVRGVLCAQISIKCSIYTPQIHHVYCFKPFFFSCLRSHDHEKQYLVNFICIRLGIWSISVYPYPGYAWKTISVPGIWYELPYPTYPYPGYFSKCISVSHIISVCSTKTQVWSQSLQNDQAAIELFVAVASFYLSVFWLYSRKAYKL